MQRRFRKLQEKHELTIAEPADDPFEVAFKCLMYDPFTINSYCLSEQGLVAVMYRTLDSMRGHRLWQMYHDMR
ncbi:hypothetical protein A1F99_109920 [Pyrenophora tritici-repentis]|nr:hypothetical protein A1F99_109920 [Pyrenophora tritici-repentis]